MSYTDYCYIFLRDAKYNGEESLLKWGSWLLGRQLFFYCITQFIKLDMRRGFAQIKKFFFA